MVTREGDLPTKFPSWAANAFNSLWTGQVYTIVWQLQQLMLAPCVQEWWNQPRHHWSHRITEFLLLDSSDHGLQDACTVLRCSCRGKAAVNHKLCSLGRAVQAQPRCQSWRQEVTRSVGPPQKFNTERKSVPVCSHEGTTMCWDSTLQFSTRITSSVDFLQVSAWNDQTIQDFLFWSPHKLIQQLPPALLKPIHQKSCGIVSLQRKCTKELHSG